PPEGGGDAAVHADRPRISALVPLRGAPAGLEDRLRRLLSALRRDDQLVLATETEDDPAYAVATAVDAAHADRDVEVVLSGPACGGASPRWAATASSCERPRPRTTRRTRSRPRSRRRARTATWTSCSRGRPACGWASSTTSAPRSTGAGTTCSRSWTTTC